MENLNECRWSIDYTVKISKFASKSGVIIVKTKVKKYISKIKFLRMDSLTSALMTLISKTI